MLTKELIEFIYRAAFIPRWNEHIRTDGFTELENQAHKTIIAYCVARCEEEEHGRKIDYEKLYEAEIFEFLCRIQLTDIKPYIKHKIQNKFGDKLNKWIYSEITSQLPDLSQRFKQNFLRYLTDENFYEDEKEILDAAAFLSTRWEFNIIKNMNQGIHGIETVAKEVESKNEEHYKFIAVRKILMDGKLKSFIDIIGKLRFQKRWTTIPRIPETSVMGHLLITAVITFFLSEQKMIKNNVTCALFHDLPESLTRDIISPVKYSVEGLDEYIKKLEMDLIEERILPLLPRKWHKDIIYYVEHEFADRYIDENGTVILTEKNPLYEYGSKLIQGKYIKLADTLAAYYEIKISKEFGIKAPKMEIAANHFENEYKEKEIYGKNFFYLFK